MSFAATNGIEVVEVFSEVESGKYGLDRRAALSAALAYAKKNKTVVLVSKLDRLSRDVAFISALMVKGVQIIVCELGLNTDAFTLHLYAALAEKERHNISSRTKQALAVLKRDGVALGNPRLDAATRAKGVATNISKSEAYRATVMPFIQPMRDKGMTFEAIANQLNSMRIRTARDCDWSKASVCNLLKAK
jgi:DNA invertase Pin-like site-specific DNA recombinase